MTDTSDALTARSAERDPAGVLGDLVTSVSFRRPSNVFDSAWAEHAPFAFWLVDVLRPRTVVELGVWTGFSFLTFCDAAAASGLDTRCIGIDTWEGDAHAGVLRPDVADIVAARADRYGDRAELVRTSFDAAAPRFPPHSIDLLHVDGLHTYEAVRHDVDTWLGRLSERGVLVLHDSAVTDRDFGVWRVVEELRMEHRGFTFTHGHGLAVVGVGSDLPTPLARLLSLDERSQDARAVREAYARLGGALGEELRTTASLRQLTHALSDRERAALAAKAREAEVDAARASRSSRTRARVRRGIGEVASVPARAARWLRRQARRTVRVVWWTVTLQLQRRLAERRARAPLAAPVDDYTRWLASYDTLTRDDLRGMERLVERLPARPEVSLLMPLCDPPLQALREAVESVLAQAYPHWELCIADDASEDAAVRRVLDELSAGDRRIRVVHRGQRGGISAASNTALASASSELCGLLDHGDVLRPHALLLMAKAFVDDPELALVYSDEDRLEDGRRFEPFFKPDWSPALLESQNYVGRFVVLRTDLARRVGAFRLEYDGAQDWDLVLRATEAAEPEQIGHVPFVLYHRRAHVGSVARATTARRLASQAGRRAVVEHLVRRGRVGAVTEGNPWPRVRVVPREPVPHVSVIVPTTARPELLDQALDGLLLRTRYPAIDIVLAIHRAALEDAQAAGSVERATASPRVSVYVHDSEPFNFARVNNEAARQAVGSYVLFLNDDIQVIEADWLETLVGQAQGERVAAVGALLAYPDRRIQHAGVCLSRMGPTHSYVGRPIGSGGDFGRLRAAHDVSASTGACLLVSKAAFDEIGGFDPRFAVAYNDIDLCLRLRERGHRIVLTPLSRLVHAESASFVSHFAGRVEEWNAELALIHERWGPLMGADVFQNPNLGDDPAHPERLAFPPRVVYPWRVDPAPGLARSSRE